jgi:hypothetical protein
MDLLLALPLFPDQDLLVQVVGMLLQTKAVRVELDMVVVVVVLSLILVLETPQVVVVQQVLFGLNIKDKK